MIKGKGLFEKVLWSLVASFLPIPWIRKNLVGMVESVRPQIGDLGGVRVHMEVFSIHDNKCAHCNKDYDFHPRKEAGSARSAAE